MHENRSNDVICNDISNCMIKEIWNINQYML